MTNGLLFFVCSEAIDIGGTYNIFYEYFNILCVLFFYKRIMSSYYMLYEMYGLNCKSLVYNYYYIHIL